jgi:hypothetical protein
MAIIRCPYCHAIIDENDKYCNNCGTQLLFSEDEEVEEEIPGEKIVDAETEEKDYTVDEPEDEKRPAGTTDLAGDIDEDLEEELKEETEELALDELVAEEEGEKAGDEITEEIILVDEIEAAEEGGKDRTKKEKDKDGTAELEKPVEDTKAKVEKEDEGEEEEEAEPEEVKEEEEEKEEEKETEAAKEEPEPIVEYITEDKDLEEAATAGESALRPITFDTTELEGIGKTVELAKDKVDQLLEVLAEKKAEQPAVLKDTERRPTGKPPTGTLPPWASTMKGAPVFPEDTGPVVPPKVRGEFAPTPTTEEEVEIFPRRRDSDSTIGLPERVSQAPLPFEGGGAEEEAGEGEAEEHETRQVGPAPAAPARPAVLPIREPDRRAFEAAEEGEEAAPSPPFSFSVFFKSKMFDVLFVGVFWLVALWLAASSMGQTLFEILGSMSGSMLLLYAVLVFLYFFLFKFFLGETLGDRLFRPRE